MGSFLCNRKFRWNFLLHKKPYRAGSHCGRKVVVARGDPPQAENPASRILFYPNILDTLSNSDCYKMINLGLQTH